MRNLLLKLGVKALLIVAVLVHWLLDDAAFFLPDATVDGISKWIFTVTGNSARFESFLKFWND